MEIPKLSLTRASLAMLGTIIGAGVFALPAAFKDAGVVTGSIVYWLFALAIIAVHLMYADVILRDKKTHRHRFTGQARELLGPWAGGLSLVTYPLYILGGLLAYIILGGEFLASLLNAFGHSVNVFVLQIVFWVIVSAIVCAGMRSAVRVMSVTVWVLIALLICSVVFFLTHADVHLLGGSNGLGVISSIGIFLFALSGIPVIPEVVDLCNRDRRRSRMAIVLGSFAAALLMWLFGVSAYLAIGQTLGSDPGQLAMSFPAGLGWIIPAVGFFAVSTPFITLSLDLDNMLQLDVHLTQPVSTLLALGAPMLLFLFISQNFMMTVSFVGAVFGALNGLFISFMSLRTAKRPSQTILPLATSVLFIAVMIWRILT